jgi:CBS domain-containing protein
MITCPFCGAENIEGADLCDECEHSLTGVGVREPASVVERGLLRDRIEILQPRKPFSVGPDVTVGETLKMMMGRGVGCVMIVDGDRMLGIFSERDALLRLNVDAAKMTDRPISEVMTVNPATLKARDKIAFALHRMNVGGFRHLPILDDDDLLVGVISIRDILAYLTERIGASR